MLTYFSLKKHLVNSQVLRRILDEAKIIAANANPNDIWNDIQLLANYRWEKDKAFLCEDLRHGKPITLGQKSFIQCLSKPATDYMYIVLMEIARTMSYLVLLRL